MLLDRKHEAEVIAKVERKYGSLEAFASYLFLDQPDVLLEEVAPEKKAALTGLSQRDIMYLLNYSSKLIPILLRMQTSQLYSHKEQGKAIKEMVRIATNESDLDVKPRDLIGADHHLLKRMGAPLSSAQSTGMVNIVINLGGQHEETTTVDARTVEAAEVAGAQELQKALYRPLSPAQLPPERARDFYRADTQQESGASQEREAVFDFYGAKTPFEAESERANPKTSP